MITAYLQAPRWFAIRDRPQSLSSDRRLPMGNLKSLLIGALVVAVGVLGYVTYQNQQNTVQIKLPSVKIEKQ
jgi:predicted negative regulator of RcsB-dependent stress response